MKYTTEDFTSPTGSKMLFATYNDDSKVVAFEQAKGYLYTSDGASMTYSMLAKQFIEEHEKTVDRVQEANEYLAELGIEAQFYPVNQPPVN